MSWRCRSQRGQIGKNYNYLAATNISFMFTGKIPQAKNTS